VKGKEKEKPKEIPRPKVNLKASENAHDLKTREGSIPTGSIPVANVVLPLNPDADATFLRPTGDQLRAVGPTKVKVGAHPD
jgi:hypothetical protein